MLIIVPQYGFKCSNLILLEWRISVTETMSPLTSQFSYLDHILHNIFDYIKT